MIEARITRLELNPSLLHQVEVWGETIKVMLLDDLGKGLIACALPTGRSFEANRRRNARAKDSSLHYV